MSHRKFSDSPRGWSVLLVPNGIGVGLEVDRCTDGLHPFKNRHNAAFVPTAFVFRCSIGSVLSLTLFVSGRFEDLLTFKLCSDLARPSSLHTEVKDFLDHLCRFLVNDPLLWIVGILLVPIGNIDRKAVATFTLCLLHRTDFAAGVSCIKLVEPVLDTCKIVVDAVGVDGFQLCEL